MQAGRSVMTGENAELPLKIITANSPWLIYALGGGWGHLMRALALGRIAASDRPVIIVCNSPYTADLLLYAADDETLPIVSGCYIHTIPATASFEQTTNRVLEAIATEDYECLIIDTFPRGLGGELAAILPQMQDITRILVHRDINPDYVRAKNLELFATDNFDLILVPGETGELPLAHLSQVKHTPPWLIRSFGELPSRAAARRLLRLDTADTKKVVLVLAAGRAEELSFYGQLTRALAEDLDVTTRCLSAERPPDCPPELWTFHWPGIECLPGVDVAVGGAGYNTFYECLAVGVPLVAFAFPRQYDRQEIRASRWLRQQRSPRVRLVDTVEAATRAVSDLLLLPRLPGSAVNGAKIAVPAIEHSLQERSGNTHD